MKMPNVRATPDVLHQARMQKTRFVGHFCTPEGAPLPTLLPESTDINLMITEVPGGKGGFGVFNAGPGTIPTYTNIGVYASEVRKGNENGGDYYVHIDIPQKGMFALDAQKFRGYLGYMNSSGSRRNGNVRMVHHITKDPVSWYHLLAFTKRPIAPGVQLTWFYGDKFRDQFSDDVAQQSLDDVTTIWQNSINIKAFSDSAEECDFPVKKKRKRLR